MAARRPDPRARKAGQQLRLGNRRTEDAFTRELRSIVRGLSSVMVSKLEPAIEARASLTNDSVTLFRADATSTTNLVNQVARKVIPQMGPKVSKAHAAMVKSLHGTYASNMREVVPIPLGKLPEAIQRAAEKARDESIKLIEEKGRQYAQDVRDLFNDPATVGMRVEDLTAKLLERGNVSESRAELVARDQTLKLAGSINQARQESAGVTSYIWNTSGDERVRDTHADLEGQVFTWDSPPEPGHPGQDIQCRCIALPVIEGLEDI